MHSCKLLNKCKEILPFHVPTRLLSNQFVPKHEPARPEDIEKLEDFLRDKQNVLVLTGAGISTESGSTKKLIPSLIDYQNSRSMNDRFT